MLSLTTTRPTLARSLHQQVLINSTTPSTSALSDSLPQPSTTPTAFDSPFTLASFRQPSAAPDNPASLSTAFGSLRSLRQPSAVSASLRSFTFDITFTPQCSHRLNSGRAPYKHYELFHLAVQPSIKFWPHFLQTQKLFHLAVQPSIKFWPHVLHYFTFVLTRAQLEHSDAPTRFPLATLTSVF